MDCSTPGFPVHHQLLSLLKHTSMESMMPSNHVILCHPFLLPPSIIPSIRIFSSESVLRIRWPKYWSFSISPSSEYSGLISFRQWQWWWWNKNSHTFLALPLLNSHMKVHAYTAFKFFLTIWCNYYLLFLMWTWIMVKVFILIVFTLIKLGRRSRRSRRSVGFAVSGSRGTNSWRRWNFRQEKQALVV